MAIKIISGAWIAANHENRKQRNTKRQQTFDEAGIKPAPSMRDVHVPAQSRLPQTLALFPDAAGSRVKDDNLAAIAGRMKAEIEASGFAAPSVMPPVEQQSLGVVAYSVELLQLYFDTDQVTSLEWSIGD